MQNVLQNVPIQVDSKYPLSDAESAPSNQRFTLPRFAPVNYRTLLWPRPLPLDPNLYLRKVLRMKDPKSGLRPPTSLPFFPESDHPEVSDGQTCAKSLPIPDAVSLFNEVQPVDVSLSQSNGDTFNDLFQGSAPQVKRFSSTAEPENCMKEMRSDVVLPSETSENVTVYKFNNSLTNFADTVRGTTEPKALPLDWLLGPKDATSPYTKVLAALILLEAKANKNGDVCEAEDFRQSWIAVRMLETGEVSTLSEGIAQACRKMFGCPIHQLPARIKARREAKLGREFPDWYDENGKLIPDSEVLSRKAANLVSAQAGQCAVPPTPQDALPGVSKKPVQSIPSSQVKEENA